MMGAPPLRDPVLQPRGPGGMELPSGGALSPAATIIRPVAGL
jgi:hypothetical protein